MGYLGMKLPDRPVVFSLVIICLTVGFLGIASARAADDASIKAALIYKLSHYVSWPDSKRESFLICSDADSRTINALRKLEQRKIKDLPVSVKPLDDNSLADPTACHIIYLTKPDSARVKGFLMGVSHDAVLTVSDIKDFSKVGGMIELSSKQQRLHFLINLKAAKEVSLEIASPLLEISTIVAE